MGAGGRGALPFKKPLARLSESSVWSAAAVSCRYDVPAGEPEGGQVAQEDVLPRGQCSWGRGGGRDATGRLCASDPAFRAAAARCPHHPGRSAMTPRARPPLPQRPLIASGDLTGAIC